MIVAPLRFASRAATIARPARLRPIAFALALACVLAGLVAPDAGAARRRSSKSSKPAAEQAVASPAPGTSDARPAADAPPTAASTLPPDNADPVRVERVKPMRDKLPSLRFLRDNRDFIRARFDRLREKPLGRDAEATAIDPRFLAYQKMLANVAAARDSVSLADAEREKQAVLASITQLGDLERQLDAIDRLLAAQRGRLGVLQADFTGDQRTELMVVVSGYPKDAAVSSITVTLEDGTPRAMPLSPAQVEALRHGGALELFHGFVEPRPQVVEVGVGGERWPAGDTGYVSLDPPRDRRMLLYLDLSPMSPGQGAPAIRANTWLHDSRIPSVDG